LQLSRWIDWRFVYRAPRERERCPACASAPVVALAVHELRQPIGGRRTGLVSGCEECGLVFVNPPPSEAELAAFYAPEGGWAQARIERPHSDGSSPAKPGSGSWVHMFDAVRGDFDVTRPPAGARVLDFGCGRGKFLDVLQDCGWETFGIEPAMDAAFARHHRLEAVPRTPTFDLIVVHHVLEHVENPLALLGELAAAARPGAYILVAVPRLDTLPVHRDYRYVISRVHVTAYTSACLEGLLARAGWSLAAPPDDEVRIAGGRRTSARLRLLARRATHPVTMPTRPLDAARHALRLYAREAGGRSTLEQRGFVRLSARVIESRRQFKRAVKYLVRLRPNTARSG
jgi:SAM-dependent methyltransferase